MVIWNYGLLHFILIASIYYYFGFFKGIVALVVLYYTVKFIGIKIGYEIGTGNDSIHLHDTEKVPHNSILIFEMEKVGFDEMKQKMEDTVIKHIKRYRQVPVNLLGFYFWKEVDKDTAKQQIVRGEKEIHDEKDVTEYCQKQLGIRMDQDRPQWQLIYVEDYQKDTSLFFFKIHHSFSDGGGIINSILFMNSTDKINQEMFKGRGIPLYMKILNSLILPIVIIIYFYFEQYKPSWKGHDKIKTKSGENSGESICILSKTYKLNDIKRCYKRFDKTTMNNFMMGLVSKSIYKWYQLNGVEEPKEVGTVVPVVMKLFSSNIDNIKMENCSSACNFKLHTKGDFEDAIKTATKGFNYYLKLPFLMHNLLLGRVFTFYPLAFGRYIYNWTGKNVDLILSNVNVGINPIYLCDKKIRKIYGYLAPFGSISLNFTYMSYSGDVYAQITSDKYLQMDARKLMSIFEELLDEQINIE